jgi:pyridoxine/pyridoxamine 5'-phosphate oxidase
MKKIIFALGILVCLVAFSTPETKAQGIKTMKNAALSATETVTNTGTAFLSAAATSSETSTTAVQVVVTKTSGTVAGTISLLGSVDGVNFKAATLTEASTALHTFTATDVASQTFIWRLTGNPYRVYRVSYTGAGTMVATFTATMTNR